MPRFPVRQLRTHLTVADSATTRAGKGRAFEDYLCTLFSAVPGIEVVHRNALNAFATEEIDIALWNASHPRGLRFLPALMLVECKNWSAPVGSAEIAYFRNRLRQRNCDHGFLIAANGITGSSTDLTASYFELATALADGTRIILLTRADLVLLRSATDFCTLVKTKLCQLVATGRP